MTRLLCVHGWGFEATFWDSLLDRLPDCDAETVDLGFGGDRRVPAVERPLVVAHSMGLAWALANIPRPWAGVMAVNGFARFTRSADFPEGVAPRLVERMLARFQDEPLAVAADFLALCGVEAPRVGHLLPEPLGEALAWLGGCDERDAQAALDCPLLAVAGGDDPIVPPAMSVAAFAGRELVLVEGAGHLLPLSHPDRLASQLRLFAARAT
jgi:pimeloyl-[acyl-carrier protein] methyl ester esterase